LKNSESQQSLQLVKYEMCKKKFNKTNSNESGPEVYQEAKEIAEIFELDVIRVNQIFNQDKGLIRTDPETGVEYHQFDTGYIQSLLLSAFSILPDNFVFELFEQDGLERIKQRIVTVETVFLMDEMYLELDELEEHLKAFIEGLRNDENAIVKTGFATFSPKNRLLLEPNLYPTKLPLIKRISKGDHSETQYVFHWPDKWKQSYFEKSILAKKNRGIIAKAELNISIETYKNGQLLEGIDPKHEAKIEKDREILFQIKLQVFEEFLRVLRKGTREIPDEKCFRAIKNGIPSKSDILYYRELDEFYAKFNRDKIPNDNQINSISPGGISYLFNALFHFEKQIRDGGKSKLITVLNDYIGVVDFSTLYNSKTYIYFELLKTLDWKKLNKHVDTYIEPEYCNSDSFVTGFDDRIQRKIRDWEVEIETDSKKETSKRPKRKRPGDNPLRQMQLNEKELRRFNWNCIEIEYKVSISPEEEKRLTKGSHLIKFRKLNRKGKTIQSSESYSLHDIDGFRNRRKNKFTVNDVGLLLLYMLTQKGNFIRTSTLIKILPIKSNSDLDAEHCISQLMSRLNKNLQGLLYGDKWPTKLRPILHDVDEKNKKGYVPKFRVKFLDVTKDDLGELLGDDLYVSNLFNDIRYEPEQYFDE